MVGKEVVEVWAWLICVRGSELRYWLSYNAASHGFRAALPLLAERRCCPPSLRRCR